MALPALSRNTQFWGRKLKNLLKTWPRMNFIGRKKKKEGGGFDWSKTKKSLQKFHSGICFAHLGQLQLLIQHQNITHQYEKPRLLFEEKYTATWNLTMWTTLEWSFFKMLRKGRFLTFLLWQNLFPNFNWNSQVITLLPRFSRNPSASWICCSQNGLERLEVHRSCYYSELK